MMQQASIGSPLPLSYLQDGQHYLGVQVLERRSAVDAVGEELQNHRKIQKASCPGRGVSDSRCPELIRHRTDIEARHPPACRTDLNAQCCKTDRRYLCLIGLVT
jgi:hypothetical protein